MEKSDVRNRQDVSKIVREFYAKVRADEELGPIFNSVITDWEEHLERLTTFWEMNLFGGKGYDGNPIAAHQHVDDVAGPIEPIHFGIWLNLWFETINANFEGEKASILLRRARKMQTVIMISIFEHRSKKSADQ
jgi:hemoglobin